MSSSLFTINDFIAGFASGATQIALGAPLDLIKLRFQTIHSDLNINKISLFSTLSKIIKEEGFLALYKGSLSPLIGNAFITAIQFSVYGFLMRKINKYRGGKEYIKKTDIILCAAFSALGYSFILSPMELFKIKMQVKEGTISKEKYKSSIDAGLKIYKNHGLNGVYSGFIATKIREFIGSGLWIGTFEICVNSQIKTRREDVPSWKILLIGSFAGIVFWVFTFPIDTIKSQIQGGEIGKHTISSVYGNIMKNHGIKGFFKGLTPCLLRTSITSSSSLFVYEKVKIFLDNK